MNVIKTQKNQYSKKIHQDFQKLGNKKIDEEIKSIISQNGNLQRIEEYKEFKKSSQSCKSQYSKSKLQFNTVNVLLKNVNKKPKYISNDEKKQKEFHDLFLKTQIDQKLKTNNLIQQKMKQIYNLKNFAEQSQQLKYPQVFSANQFEDDDYKSKKQEIFDQLLKQENDLISVDLNTIALNYKNNISDKQTKNHKMTNFCWKLIFIKLDKQNCPLNTQEQEDRIKKINKINQHYIDINYLPIMTNQEKITLMLKNHPDYINHVTGKCKCYTCNCNLSCKCGFRQLILFFKVNLQSIYGTDFKQNLNQQIQYKLNNDIAQQVNTLKEVVSPMNIKVTDQLLKSIKMMDFQENQIDFVNPRFQDLQYQRQNPIGFLSNNEIQYVKQFKQGREPFNTESQPTLINDLKFVSKSSYQKDFNSDTKSFRSHGTEFNNARLSQIPLKYKHQYDNLSKKSLDFKVQEKPKIFIAPENLHLLNSKDQLLRSQSQQDYSPIDVQQCI